MGAASSALTYEHVFVACGPASQEGSHMLSALFLKRHVMTRWLFLPRVQRLRFKLKWLSLANFA